MEGGEEKEEIRAVPIFFENIEQVEEHVRLSAGRTILRKKEETPQDKLHERDQQRRLSMQDKYTQMEELFGNQIERMDTSRGRMPQHGRQGAGPEDERGGSHDAP